MTNRNPALPAVAPAKDDSRRIRLAVLVIAVAGLAAYANSLNGAFVLDDLPTISDNPAIRRLWPLWSAFFPSRTNLTVGGRPVANFTLALNYALSGNRVWSYHAFNLGVHILAGLTLFGIVRRTLVGQARAWATRIAFIAALFWIVHPLQTEAVTYVVQRTESLMGLWYLLTLYCFIRGAESGGPWLALSAGCCLLGMATKEVMVTAPLAVLLYDRTFAADSFSGAWLRRKAYYLSLAATWLPLAALVGTTGWNRGGTAGFGAGASVRDYALTQIKAVAHYLRLSVWPRPLVFDYGEYLVHDPLTVVLPGALLALLVAATAVGLARRSGWGFLGAWFVLTLAPTSSLIPVATQTMAEHRMYLALAAVTTAAAIGLHALLGRWSLPAAIAVACVLGGLTAARNRAYRTEERLWRDTIASFPGNDRAHTNLGSILLNSGRVPEAVEQFRTALRINSGDPVTHYDMGNALLKTGQIPAAIDQFETALRIKPNDAEAHNNLGNVLAQQGRLADGIAHFEAAVRIKPDYVQARFNLGSALFIMGRTDAAIEQFEALVRINPNDAETHNDLGNLLMRAGRVADAAAEYRAALRTDGNNVTAHNNLGSALLKLGEPSEAIAEFEAALQVDPSLPESQCNLGNALLQLGRIPEAIGYFEAALRAKPDYAKARAGLDRARALLPPP